MLTTRPPKPRVYAVLPVMLLGRKAVHIKAWTGPQDSSMLRLPEFLDIRHMKVAILSDLHTDNLYPQVIFVVLIDVRRCVDPMAIVRPEVLCQ
jgi:hypothetical protein